MDQKEILWNEYFLLKNTDVNTEQKQLQLSDIEHKLLIEYLYLVRIIASRLDVYLTPYIDIDDLISVGTFGLMDAIKKFDLSKKASFLTYATLRIRGSILDEIRNLDWVPRSCRSNQKKVDKTISDLEMSLGRCPTTEEIAAALEMSIQGYYEMKKNNKPYAVVSLEDKESVNIDTILDNSVLSLNDYAEKKEAELNILKALSKLPLKERDVIYYYYFEDLKLKDISKILNICESRASQLHKKALKSLEDMLSDQI